MSSPDSSPTSTPKPTQATSPHQTGDGPVENGNSGPAPNRTGRQQIAAIAAVVTGMKLRGRHSNSRSSTASSTDATGVPKMPVIPAAAPATRSVFLSTALRWKNCANSDPMAPPVMMIGPSAPKGPPVPIEIAEESGLRIATLGDMRLLPIRMASIASGMPCPLIFSEPNLAMRPMASPPSTGASTIHGPLAASAIDGIMVPILENQTRLVTSAISLTRNQAANAPPVPTTSAMPASISTRGSALKSARRSARRSEASRATARLAVRAGGIRMSLATATPIYVVIRHDPGVRSGLGESH